MQKNVGGNDRTARLILGTLLILAGAAGYTGLLTVGYVLPQALTSILLALIGLVLVVTGYTQKCMINSMLGIDTHEE